MKRCTSKEELEEVIEYWQSMPRGSGWADEASLIGFLEVFTPDQIKGAMYLATAGSRRDYFKYLCGILHGWKREREEGKEPHYFRAPEESR